MPSAHQDQKLLRYLARQRGLITWHQALSAGVTRSSISRLVSAGTWRHVHPQVFADARAPVTWEQRLFAACLWAGDPAVASHRAAARLSRLEDAVDPTVEITSPRRLRHPEVLTHRSRLGPREVTRFDGIPCTVIPRTLVDLASVVDQDRVASAFDAAVSRGLITATYLRRWLERYEHPPHGAAVIRGLAADHMSSPVESNLERALLRLLREAKLPLPVAQYVVRTSAGIIARLDFAYPDHKIALECDGYRWHSGRDRWQRDLARRNGLVSAGWRLLHFTHWDIEQQPQGIVTLIREALGRSTLFEADA